MKYIIYGVGQFLKKRIDLVNLEEVVCFTDKNKNGGLCFGKKVISPDELTEYQYDGIVIATDLYFNEISSELVFQHRVNIHKIWSWGFYIALKNVSYVFFDGTSISMIKCICEKLGVRSILDRHMIIAEKVHIGHLEGVQVDAIDNILCTSIVKNQYNNVWNSYEEVSGAYDIELYWKSGDVDSVNKKADSSWISVLNNNVEEYLFKKKRNFNLYNYKGYLYAVDMNDDKELHIYQVTHKLFNPVNIDCYIPIHAGKKGKVDLGYLGDNTGDNISEYNDLINECTALYWIWKNDVAPIVGLNHYRRLFLSPINPYLPLQNIEVQMLMKKYDVIVAEPVFWWESCVETPFAKSINEEAYQRAYAKLNDIFERKEKNEREALRYVFNGHMIYPCNMFIMNRELLNEYCSWLFSILFELIDNVEIDEAWDNYSKRIIGFIAERLFTVWLVQKRIRIKELPIVKTDDNGAYGK